MGKHKLWKNLAGVVALSATTLLLSGWGWAAQYPQDPAEAAAPYLAGREKLHIVGELSPEALATPTALPGGVVVELTGEIVGHTSVGRADKTTYCLLLRMPNGLTVSLECSEPIKGLDVGEDVQVLATVPKQGANGRHFELNYIVRQCDLPAEMRLPAATSNQGDQPPTSPAASEPSTDSGQDVAPPPTDAGPGQVDWGNRRVRPAPGTPVPEDPEQQKVEIWKAWVQQHNSKLTDTECEKIVSWVLGYSRLYGVNHLLIFAVIEAESYFDPTCVSHAGAVGLMQLMPSTAKHTQVADRWNVQENIRGGIQYLSEQLARYADKSNYEQCVLGLACYNAGPGAVKKYGGVPPYRETRNYVIKVPKRFAELHEQGYP